MLKKILNKKQVTENVGDAGENNTQVLNSVPFVCLNTEDGDFSAELKNKVTIGSEVGDLIVAHEQISPRHCTFFCNKGVFSLIDHASKSGTFINKKRIEPNRVYLLDSKDSFRIGKVQVKIEFRESLPESELIEETTSSQTDIPDLPSEDEATREISVKNLAVGSEHEVSGNAGELNPESEATEEILSNTQIKELNEKAEKEETIIAKSIPLLSEDRIISSSAGAKDLEDSSEKKKGKSAKKVKLRRASSSSALTRVNGFFNDVLITYITVEICSVFTEFNEIYKSIPDDLLTFVMPTYEQLASEYPFLEDLTVQVNGIEKTREIFDFLIFLLVIKIITSLVLSLSFGQLLAGMKVVGNFLWKRLIAPVRIFLGIVLFPFLIFDLPTIFSKRSFKEVVTGTQYVTRSGILVFLARIFATMILIMLALISPIYKGGEEMRAVAVKNSSRALPPHEYANPVFIEELNLTFDDVDSISLLPTIDLEMRNRKEILRSGVLLIDNSTSAHAEIKMLKSFSFTELFASFIDENPMSPQFQPEIFSLVRNVANQNKNFDLNVKNRNQLINEISQLTKDSFEIKVENFPDFALRNGIFLGAFRDYREKLIGLYPLPPNEIGIMNFGGEVGIMATHGAGRLAYSTFIPIGDLRGVMYKIEGNINSTNTKKILKTIRFGNKATTGDESLIADYVNKSHGGVVKDDIILNQEVYERFFKASKLAMEEGSQRSLELLKTNLNQFINILNLDDNSNQKLTQNLTEILQALKTDNKEFFAIKTTEVI